MEAHWFLAQDPMLTDGMTDKVQEMGNAPAAILASAAESARFSSLWTTSIFVSVQRMYWM